MNLLSGFLRQNTLATFEGQYKGPFTVRGTTERKARPSADEPTRPSLHLWPEFVIDLNLARSFAARHCTLNQSKSGEAQASEVSCCTQNERRSQEPQDHPSFCCPARGRRVGLILRVWRMGVPRRVPRMWRGYDKSSQFRITRCLHMQSRLRDDGGNSR